MYVLCTCVYVRDVVLDTAVSVSRALDTNFMRSWPWSWSWEARSWSQSWRVGLNKFKPVRCTVQSYLELASSSLSATVKNSLCIGQLVSWSLTSPFSTNMAISETKGRVESYLYSVKEGQRYVNHNPGRLFVQQPPKRERDQEAHLNYYASAYNRGRQLSHRMTKLNQIQQNTRINLN